MSELAINASVCSMARSTVDRISAILDCSALETGCSIGHPFNVDEFIASKVDPCEALRKFGSTKVR